MRQDHNLRHSLWLILLVLHGILFCIPILYSWGIFKGKLFFPLPFMVLLLGGGLVVSFMHKDRANFYITTFTYTLVILLVTLTLMDAFSSPDPFMKVLEAIYYTMVMFTFILYTQRDFLLLEFIYFIFLTTVSVRSVHKPYFYILAFLGVWVINLRILFLENIATKVDISQKQAGRYLMRQLPLALFTFTFIFIFSLGASRFIPRLNIPLAFLDFLKPQERTLSYIDRERLDSNTQAPATTFLDIQGKQKSKQGYKISSAGSQKTLELEKNKKKPVVWIGYQKGHLKLSGESPQAGESQKSGSQSNLAKEISKVAKSLEEKSRAFKEKGEELEKKAKEEMAKGNIMKASSLQQKAKERKAQAEQLIAQAEKMEMLAAALLGREKEEKSGEQLRQEAESLQEGLHRARKQVTDKSLRKSISEAIDSLSDFIQGSSKPGNLLKPRWRFRWWVLLIIIILLIGLLCLLLFLTKCIRRLQKLKSLAGNNINKFFVKVCEETWGFLGDLGRKFREYHSFDKLKDYNTKLIPLYKDYLQAKFSTYLLTSQNVKIHILSLQTNLDRYSQMYRWPRIGFYCWKLSLRILASAIKS